MVQSVLIFKEGITSRNLSSSLHETRGILVPLALLPIVDVNLETILVFDLSLPLDFLHNYNLGLVVFNLSRRSIFPVNFLLSVDVF